MRLRALAHPPVSHMSLQEPAYVPFLEPGLSLLPSESGEHWTALPRAFPPLCCLDRHGGGEEEALGPPSDTTTEDVQIASLLRPICASLTGWVLGTAYRETQGPVPSLLCLSPLTWP